MIGLRTKAPRRQASAEQIAEAWRQRWLYSRIQSDEVLGQLAARNAETIRRDLLPADETGQLVLVF